MACWPKGERCVSTCEVPSRKLTGFRVYTKIRTEFEEFFERDAGLHSGHSGADAVVRAETKGQMSSHAPRDLAVLRFGAEFSFVSIRRAVEEHDFSLGWNGSAP